MYSANTWPIAANMLGFGNRAHDGGGHIKDAPAAVWASQLRQVRELGFDYIDPTDAWVPLAALSDSRIEEFRTVLSDEGGLAISSISMTRNSVVDVNNGERNVADAHRLIDLAPSFGGATIVNTGFMQAVTPEQSEQIWFWLVEGHVDDPACAIWPSSESANSVTTAAPTGFSSASKCTRTPTSAHPTRPSASSRTSTTTRSD